MIASNNCREQVTIQRRKSEIQRPKAWNLLNKEWKALAFLAVNQAAPESIDPDSSNGKSARPNRRIGRRGGRGGRSGLQDRWNRHNQ